MLRLLRLIVALFRRSRQAQREDIPTLRDAAVLPTVQPVKERLHLSQPITAFDHTPPQAQSAREVTPQPGDKAETLPMPAAPVTDVADDADASNGLVLEAPRAPVRDVVGEARSAGAPEAAADGERASLVAGGRAAATVVAVNNDAADAGDGTEPGPQPLVADASRGARSVVPLEPVSFDEAECDSPTGNGAAPNPGAQAPAGQAWAVGSIEMEPANPDPAVAEPSADLPHVPLAGPGSAAADAYRVGADEQSAGDSMSASEGSGDEAVVDPGPASPMHEALGRLDASFPEISAAAGALRSLDVKSTGELGAHRPAGLEDPADCPEPAVGPSADDGPLEDTSISSLNVADLIPDAPDRGSATAAEEHGDAALLPGENAGSSAAAASTSSEAGPGKRDSDAAAASEAGAGVGIAAVATAQDTGSGRSAVSDPVAAAAMRKPGEYRPRLNRARTRRLKADSSSGGGDIQSLSADLLLLIGAANWGVQLSALLRIPAGAEEEVAVDQDGVETWLGHLDDQLLEPLALLDASAAFGEPLLVTAAALPVRWSRSSRDLHVLGPHPRVAGFASQARVVIGQECVVICREGLAEAARERILATGSAEPMPIEGPNVPAGWVCWRGVRPVRPSPPVGGGSILDALDPLPAVSIEFSGGIQLSRAAWLEGRPPSIRLLGLMSEGDPVLIDGAPASRDGAGDWTAPGWDRPGAHSVDHGGKSASYAIARGADGWEWWPAWEGPTWLAGALSEAGGGELFHHSGPAALLGARPGQICGFAPSTFGVGVARPDFEPVWLVTAPGTRRAGVSLIGQASPPGMPVGPNAALERWVRTVCSCGRMGAVPSGEREAWSRYVAIARSHRRRRR